MDNEPKPLIRKEAKHAANLLDRLYHGQFRQVLKPDAFDAFKQSVFSYALGVDDTRPADLVVQFFISESTEEFAEAGALHWFGIKYGLEVQGDNVSLDAIAVITPKDPNQDILMMPEFEHTPVCVLQWSDVAWDSFDPELPVHP